MSRCIACNQRYEVTIDYDYCNYCIKVSNEARMELEDGYRHGPTKLTAFVKDKNNKTKGSL
jgi:hypothetical protein